MIEEYKLPISIEINSALRALQTPELLTEEMAKGYSLILSQVNEEELRAKLGEVYLDPVQGARDEYKVILEGGAMIEGENLFLCNCKYSIDRQRKELSRLADQMQRVFSIIGIIAENNEISECNSEKYLKAKKELKPIFTNPDEVGKFLQKILPYKGKNEVIHSIIIDNEVLFRNTRQKKKVHSILWMAGYIKPSKKGQTEAQNYECFKNGYQ